jgi:hypothetical protein
MTFDVLTNLKKTYLIERTPPIVEFDPATPSQ